MTDLRRSETQRAAHAHTRRLHEQRLGQSNGNGNGHVSDEVLARAWRDVQLHWLGAYPAYREIVRARVSEAARRAELLSTKIDRGHAEVDYIGRSIEGCG
jgi:hypothetical protein